MKKTEEEYFERLMAIRKKEDIRGEKDKKDRSFVSGTLDMLRDVRNQWIEAENYGYIKPRRKID